MLNRKATPRGSVPNSSAPRNIRSPGTEHAVPDGQSQTPADVRLGHISDVPDTDYETERSNAQGHKGKRPVTGAADPVPYNPDAIDIGGNSANRAGPSEVFPEA